VLDVLPAAVLRKTADGSIEQLHARTHLADANAFTKIMTIVLAWLVVTRRS
jgi:hypothetical protein